MADNVTKEIRSKTMRTVKSSGSAIEKTIFQELAKRKIHFKKQTKPLPGKPDLSIKKYKLVVFIDSCFWHGCPEHCRMPSSNTEYWNKKISRNIERDAEINKCYQDIGWQIIRIWEHEIKHNLAESIDKIANAVKNAAN